ncbi:bifunctional SulP family inorganic anion transporter/carbonic anhydrase [Gimesia maris]|uniref:Carbonic anhydrase 2 n=1 Tax=Gimesia maris TaxID=122 RepID=A0ABX5YSZ4_9PLAN|nr:SulP family inorganic anion transporter [Gimesia maris]EDL60197.1 probable sulfate transporter [Gimesia maris DSM 8797]QDU16646.1 Carbonic anhydrase 2 [Gimesia maris]QEG18687.1 Carbonic anhydrase 2 [Gimesia maris]
MSDARLSGYPLTYLPRDLTAGLVVFLVALPLCLGIALASGAPLFSGLVSGIIGGIVVGSISGSSTSVSGPAAGLTAIVIAQIAALGSFEAFLLAVMLGGVIQIVLGIVKAGSLSAFFPSSVIKGLLAAIGVILILKQIPHVVGHDSDPEGEMSFTQPDKQNTFSEILTVFEGDIHYGAAVVGLSSIALLVLWGRIKMLKNSVIPGPLMVVLLGVSLHILFQRTGGPWAIEASHLVQIPVAETAGDLLTFLKFPDFTQWANPAIYVAAATIAIVASLETLLNLEAVDKLDPENRNSPSSRELIAQGVGNVTAGMIGGLPVTSVIVRGSVNVNAGAKTKVSCIFHGVLLLISVALIPVYMNMIPLAALAAILLVTGFKLASPALFRQMWSEGRYQFLPFMITLLSIVFTDLLIGILIGLGVSLLFILNSSLRQPIRRIVETHAGGDVLHVELANQVSFLNRAALDTVFNDAPPGTNMLIDASGTDYIDPDILSLIQEFKDKIGPARGMKVSLRGFRKKYQLNDEIQFADYSTRELKDRITPDQVLQILREGNERFYTGNRLSRDLGHQVNATAGEQNPLAVVLSCIDSRVPAELVLDLGIGDIFSVRVAGNVIGNKSLGSIEYGVAVVGVKLVLVLGHTRCGAVTSTVELMCEDDNALQVTGCSHLESIVNEIVPCVDEETCSEIPRMSQDEKERFIDETARRNVCRSVYEIKARSEVLRNLVDAGKVMVVGALYDVKSGKMEFLTDPSAEPEYEQSPQA